MKRSDKKNPIRQFKQAQMIEQARSVVNNSEPVVCAKCGCPHFDEVKTVRYVSKLLSPQGQEGYIFIPLMVCLGCMTPLPNPGSHKTIKLPEEGHADDQNRSETEPADNGDVGEDDARSHISLDP